MITHLSPSAFAQKMIDTPGIVLDVRTPEEYNDFHLPNAHNINFYEMNFKKLIEALEKDKNYFVYCRSGARSIKTVEIMREKGFYSIYHLESGITGYINAGLSL